MLHGDAATDLLVGRRGWRAVRDTRADGEPCLTGGRGGTLRWGRKREEGGCGWGGVGEERSSRCEVEYERFASVRGAEAAACGEAGPPLLPAGAACAADSGAWRPEGADGEEGGEVSSGTAVVSAAAKPLLKDERGGREAGGVPATPETPVAAAGGDGAKSAPSVSSALP